MLTILNSPTIGVDDTMSRYHPTKTQG